ncbi:MAG: hypothetical protein KDH88_08095 [Chromatiales bacterium]|nr:hypothetical protein [Chromatiales bacterium]
MQMRSLFAGLFFWSLSTCVWAGSEIPFPADWKNWESVSTALTGIGALPGCDADVSALPPIYQETVETYCNVRPEGPGAVEILVDPAQTAVYSSRAGGYKDGADMILRLKDLGVLFVTGHHGGKALYGVFKEDGTDITSAEAGNGLSAGVCRECHSGYSAFCVEGQCGSRR